MTGSEGGAWRPISTAPTEGADLLILWSPSTHTYPVGGRFWTQDGLWVEENAKAILQPTHWMPLPPPPQGEPA